MDNNIVMVRTRHISSSEVWVESFEDGSWRQVGSGSAEYAEQLRNQKEEVLMAQKMGIW